MKKLYMLCTAMVLTCFSTYAQLGVDTYELGADNANNYPGASWTTTNQGTGFSDWTFDTATPSGGAAGRFIGSFSAAIDVSGNSFGMFANSAGGAVSGAATSMPKSMEEGDSFSVSVGVNFRDGNKGFDLRDSSNSTIINFNVGSDQYNITGTSGLFSNAYDANTVFTFTFTQNASDVSWTVVRSGGLTGTQSGSIGSISPGTIENVRFYNVSAGNVGGSERDFFVNSLEFESTYTIAGNSIVSASSGDTTVPYLDVQSGSTLNIPSDSNVTVSGDLDNTGSINVTSTSSQFPSLIVNGTASGNITYNRFVNSNTNGNDLISPPVVGQSWSDFLTDNATPLLDNGATGPTTYAFAEFDKTTGDYENYTDATSATLTSGRGYRAATDSGETLAFIGSVETGTVSVDIQNSGPEFAKWNLIGNPYSSYINVQDFLNHEVSTGVTNLQLFDAGAAAIYGYDGDVSNGWTTYNLASTTPSTVIAPGQGFFVSADATNASLYDLEFTSDMRSTGTDDDFIAGRGTCNGLVFFRLLASAGADSYSTRVFFNDNATTAFNFGFDAELFSIPPFVVYTELVEINSGTDPTVLDIQAVNTSDLDNVTIPVGMNATQGQQVTFTLSENCLPGVTEVILDDLVENTSTSLTTGDYVVTLDTNLSGTGRFFLNVFDTTLSTTENSLETLSVIALNSSKEILVRGQLQNNARLNLFDIQGRNVLATSLDATNTFNRVDVTNLSAGIYIVNIEGNTQTISQKLIIK